MAVAETLKDKAGCGEPGEEKKKREKRVSESKREKERKKERKKKKTRRKKNSFAAPSILLCTSHDHFKL